MKRVLLIGEGRDYRAGRVLLARSDLTVAHIADLKLAVASFVGVTYDVVVLDYTDSLARAEPAKSAFDLLLPKSSRRATIFGSSSSVSIDELLAALQAPTSASRHARFVLHVDAVDRSAVRQLVGAHAEHLVVVRDAKPGEFDRVIAALLDVAPRADERVAVRLRTCALAGPVTAACETVNLSRSGMLIASGCLYAPGAKVDFELDLVDGGKPCAGVGEVVRLSMCDQPGRYGVALRFVFLSASDHERLEAFLRRRTADEEASRMGAVVTDALGISA